MAASRAAIPNTRLADLREMRGGDLDWILTEQGTYWRKRFRWDFDGSRDIIRRFLDTRRLQGYALVAGDRPVGYCYFIPEDGKALVGDLFLAEEFRDSANEAALLTPTLRAAAVYPGVRRIEGQLLSLSTELPPQALFSRPVRDYARLYMVNDRLGGPQMVPRRAGVRVSRWAPEHLESTAGLIAEAYFGHVDSEINDQYRSLTGARRFLLNTTQHTGCGVFLSRASVAAWPRDRYRLSGVCLASGVGSGAGHITQLCVSSGFRGMGLGRELLSRSLTAIRSLGLDAVSLTVTAQNTTAVRLYESMGFRVWRRFSAFVWEAD